MLLFLTALASSQAINQAPAKVDPIVVTGRRIDDASASLKACLARRCSPNEDIDATLRLAETQLMAGKYREARTTLLAALRRNKDEAKAYPIPVSDLYRANGKVAAHLGYDRDYYHSTWGIYRTLKQGMPTEDHRKYTALMEVAEMMFRTRGHERARLYYDRVADEARQGGREDIAALAQLRSAIRHLPPGSDMQVRAIERIADMDDKRLRAPVLEAKMALARIAYAKNDEAAAQAIQNELAAYDIKRPMLIYSPPYELVQRELDTGSDFAFPYAPSPAIGGEPGGGGNPPGTATVAGGNPGNIQSAPRATITSIVNLSQWTSTKRIPGNYEDMWLDVSFRISDEGRVTDAKIVRSKGDLSWAKPLMKSISLRRYTAGKPGDPGSVRTERYTYTSGYEGQTGSRVGQRSPKARVEYFDLSDIASPL